MNVKFSPTQGVLRFYEPGKSYENRDPFVAVANVLIFDAETIAIVGMCGKITRTLLKEALLLLIGQGFKKLMIERNSRIKTVDLTKLRITTPS